MQTTRRYSRKMREEMTRRGEGGEEGKGGVKQKGEGAE